MSGELDPALCRQLKDWARDLAHAPAEEGHPELRLRLSAIASQLTAAEELAGRLATLESQCDSWQAQAADHLAAGERIHKDREQLRGRLAAAEARCDHLQSLVPLDHRWRAAPPTAAQVSTCSWWWNKPADGVPHILQLDCDLGSGRVFDAGEASSGICAPPFDPTDWPGEWAPCMTPDDVESEVARFERIAQRNAQERNAAQATCEQLRVQSIHVHADSEAEIPWTEPATIIIGSDHWSGTVSAILASSLTSPARHMRPVTRRLLRGALAIARDALASSSENFRGEVQDVLVDLLGEPAAIDGDEIEGEPAIVRLGELRRAAGGLASPDLRRCALCDEVLSPAEGKTFDVDDDGDPRQITLHDDLPHCAFLMFSRALRAWAAERRFDDDQDPALDTIDQRLVRAYGRLAALVGDSDDALAARVSCDVCDAFGYGSATCWSCVAHWRWAAPGLRREMIARLIDRTPGRPCGPEEVQAFIGRLAATTRDASDEGRRSAEILGVDNSPATHQAHSGPKEDDSREIPWPNTGLDDLDLRRAVGSCIQALRSGHLPPDEDISALRGRGDRLAQFAELDGAVAALLRTIDDEAAQQAERGDR